MQIGARRKDATMGSNSFLKFRLVSYKNRMLKISSRLNIIRVYKNSKKNLRKCMQRINFNPATERNWHHRVVTLLLEKRCEIVMPAFCKASSNPSSFILIISFKKCNCLTIHAPKVQGMNQLKLVICYGTDNQDNVFTLLEFQAKSKLDIFLDCEHMHHRKIISQDIS